MKTTLATEGQLVIPKSIQDRLQIEPGDELEIWVDEERQIILRPLGHRKTLGLLDHLCSAPGELELPKRSVEMAEPMKWV